MVYPSMEIAPVNGECGQIPHTIDMEYVADRLNFNADICDIEYVKSPLCKAIAAHLKAIVDEYNNAERNRERRQILKTLDKEIQKAKDLEPYVNSEENDAEIIDLNLGSYIDFGEDEELGITLESVEDAEEEFLDSSKAFIEKTYPDVHMDIRHDMMGPGFVYLVKVGKIYGSDWVSGF